MRDCSLLYRRRKRVEVGNRFEQLRQAFVSTLPKRLKRIGQLWQKLLYLRWDQRRLDVLINEVHKLVGTAGTYGLSELSLRARALEAVLERVRDAEGALSAEQRELVSQILNELELPTQESEGPEVAPSLALKSGQPRIAIVEDDPQLGQLVSHWMDEIQVRADLFPDPEAFAAATERRCHALLLDLSFPGAKDGGLEWLKGPGRRWAARLPVIIMTHRTDIVSRIQALRLGATGYLVKPISRSNLVQRVEQALRLGQKARDRVLVLDDDPDMLRYYRILLEEAGFEVVTLAQPLELLETLAGFLPDLIILDYQMPACNGLELAQMLRQDDRYFQIPVLFVSGAPEAHAQRELLSIVGNACLSKPLDDVVLLMHIRRLIAQARRRLVAIESVSQRLTDQGLLNRAAFYQHLDQYVMQVRQGRLPEGVMSLVFLQVCEVSKVREVLGLRGSAELGNTLEGLVARARQVKGLGAAFGDTAMVCLFTCSDGQVRTAVEAWLAQLESELSRRAEMHVSLAAGIVPFSEATISGEAAMHEAEKALDRALTGNARVVVERPETDQPGLSDEQDRMAEALLNRRFTLEFQPVVAVEAGEVLHEALIRLQDPGGGLYSPGEFLDVARKLNLDHELDRWVIDDALEKVWAKAVTDVDIQLIIKLMPHERHLDHMLRYLSEARTRYDWPRPVRVCVALPEPWVAHNLAGTRRLVGRLHDESIGFVLEQAGQTHRTEEILGELRVSYLKLSHALTRKAATEPDAQDRVRTFMRLLDGEGEVIAAGVEDARAFSTLWALGIRLFQGYFIEAPAANLETEATLHVDMDDKS
ncbi:MAG: EAL domain-containing protein [Gammaproteobacteria bacterium]|nr:MAG: EAL domain-containing protein [Gammaproteobacteria bacterium]